MVDIKDSNIVAGSVGWVDVEIYAATGFNYDIALADYEFEIVPIAGSGSLEFLASQETNEQSESVYLFFDVGTTTNFVATSNDPLQYVGGDFTNDVNMDPDVVDFAKVNVAADRKLLARLDVKHVTANPSATVGSTFAIRMVSGRFETEEGMEINFDAATNSSPGIATITAVPEPSSLLLIAGAGSGWLAYRKRRSKPSTSHNP